MRLTLLISSLGPGGAERILSILANQWSARGDEISLLTLAPSSADFYPIDPRIVRIGLDRTGVSGSLGKAALANAARIRILRREVRRQSPDVVVSFGDQTNVLAVLSTMGLEVPVVITELVDPRRHDIGRIWQAIRLRTYPWADAIVVQNESIASWVTTHLPRLPCWIISNPVPPARLPHPADDATKLRPRVVSVGRLTHQKGYDVLLEAFARIAGELPGWHLRVVGEGPDRADLTRQAARLGLTSRIELTGVLTEPWAGIGRDDLFVLPSRYEGEPSALLEAMAAGVPAIASRACGVLEDGVTGLVVPDEDPGALATAMLRLMRDRALATHLAAAAREQMTDRAPARILARWDRVLASVGQDPSQVRRVAADNR